MADITPTVETLLPAPLPGKGPVAVIVWAAVTENDTPLPAILPPGVLDAAWTVTGTFGGATGVGWEGSNGDVDNGGSDTFFDVPDSTNTAIALSAAGAGDLLHLFAKMQPKVGTPGSSQSLNFRLKITLAAEF